MSSQRLIAWPSVMSVFGWRFWSTWPCSLVSATSAAPYVFKVSRMYRAFLVSGSVPA